MPGKGIVPRRSLESRLGESERVGAQRRDLAHPEFAPTRDLEVMPALKEALKGATALALNCSEEHGTEGLGDLAIGENRGEGKVHAFDFPGEGFPDKRVMKGTAGVDLTLKVMAALCLRDSDGVAGDAIPEVVGTGATLQANGRVHGRDESLQACGN